MKKTIFIYILSLISFSCFSQTSTCNNADFEVGSFTGWVGQTGSCCPIVTSPSGIISGQHTIMTGTGTDARACNLITEVAPGSTYSAKLGNEYSGSQAEKLSYSLTVAQNSSLFIYKYAVVLEDPGHSPSEQPRFQVRVLNAAGGLIDPSCGVYTVVADSTLPGWQICNGVVFKDWTTVGLDLSPYVGQVITVEFATGDCSLGAHFGYAYVDAYYSPLQINNGFCSGSFSATLAAPIGFGYLWNTGETTQTINILNPIQGTVYQCTLTSVTGCTVNISTILEPADMTADFELDNTCYTNATFTDTSITPATSPVTTYLWTFGGGGTSTDAVPTHAFPASGTYPVTLAATNSSGCTSSRTKNVTVIPPATASLNYASPFCMDLTTDQAVNLTGTLLYQNGTFSTTPGLTLNTTTGAINPSTSSPGTYVVSYAIPQSNLCTPIPATATVTITAVPTASISYSGSPYCSTISSSRSVNFSGTGAAGGGVYSATPAGLSINPSTGDITPSTSSGGTYTVTYTVPASGGCAAFPVTTTVKIIFVPTATINYSAAAFCTSVNTAQAVIISGTGTYTGGVYSSTSGLSLNTSTGDIVPSTSTPGTYTISYKIPQGTLCLPLPATTTITIKPTPIASSPSQVICSAEISQVNLTSTIPGTTFSWSEVSTGVIGSASGTGNAIVQVLATTADAQGTVLYTISSDYNGCPGSPINATVTVNPLPLPQLEDGSICINQETGLAYKTYTFDTLLDVPTYSFEWFFAGNAPFPIPGAAGSTYVANQIGQYTVIATNIATNCPSTPVSANITASFPAIAIISTESPLFTDDATIIVQGGTGTYLYQLDGGIFQSSNVFTNLPSGVHTAVVIDTEGCTHISAEFTIIHYPVYFTPNDDGFHDYWNVFDLYFQPGTKIYIYDRNGKMVKQISTTGQGWDGTYNGKQLPSEDYWFVVDYFEMGTNKKFKSHFALKR